MVNDFIEWLITKDYELNESEDFIIKLQVKESIKDKTEDGESDELNKKLRNSVREFINHIGLDRIKEELANDFIKRLTKIEESEKDHTNLGYKIEELGKEFAMRITKIGRLPKIPLTIDIVDEGYLQFSSEDLGHLFCRVRKVYIPILAGKLINNNDIVILTNFGIFIFHLTKSLKLISLDYFYYISDVEKIYKKDVINYDLIYGWVSYIKDNNEGFLKYGAELFKFAIEVKDLELINDIYKRCLKLFDLEENKGFLSIITTSMPLLKEYYPEYIKRYSSDTRMIMDDYKMEYHSNSHLCLFSNIEIVDLTRSISWTKYTLYYYLAKLNYRWIFYLTFPISFPLFHILNYFHIVNEVYYNGFYYAYYKSYDFISKKLSLIFYETQKSTITFINPYIKFVSYPQDYVWWQELIKPQSSPFVQSIDIEICNTFNGEALINFKWNLYGKYYYALIWIIFIVFLGCFTAATAISENVLSISDHIRKQLLKASIILGFFHLINEIRQFIYDPNKWVRDPWNYLGKYSFVY